jgi:hypothetical protein
LRQQQTEAQAIQTYNLGVLYYNLNKLMPKIF